jgi:hypothetical protein
MLKSTNQMLRTEESKLELWASDPSATEESRINHTVKLIQNKLNQNLNIDIIQSKIGAQLWFHVYPQGSFANCTNVKNESDIDLVIECNSLFECNLSSDEKQKLRLRDINYHLPELRNDIFFALKSYFGDEIREGNKSLIIRSNSNRIEADVVPAFLYRFYNKPANSENDVCANGIILLAKDDNTKIINFPLIHLQNCERKNTSGNFKKIIRIFKNIRNELIEKKIISEKLAPSYYIENLLYNCPDQCFSGTLQQCLQQTLFFLNSKNTDYSSFICANGFYKLFSRSTWSLENAFRFNEEVIRLVYKPDTN